MSGGGHVEEKRGERSDGIHSQIMNTKDDTTARIRSSYESTNHLLAPHQWIRKALLIETSCQYGHLIN